MGHFLATKKHKKGGIFVFIFIRKKKITMEGKFLVRGERKTTGKLASVPGINQGAQGGPGPVHPESRKNGGGKGLYWPPY